ncbi:MAG: hypothetical protein M3Y77_13550 [Actinomycetota bacterium]|nr:hypothetical protein [Actinomycetota bacterium]
MPGNAAGQAGATVAGRSELARLTPEQAAGEHDLDAVLAALALATGSPSPRS